MDVFMLGSVQTRRQYETTKDEQLLEFDFYGDFSMYVGFLV